MELHNNSYTYMCVHMCLGMHVCYEASILAGFHMTFSKRL